MADYEKMDKMLTPKEVAELLHIHTNTLRRWSDKGRIVAYRINPRGDRRYRLRDIERFLAQTNVARESARRVRWTGENRRAAAPLFLSQFLLTIDSRQRNRAKGKLVPYTITGNIKLVRFNNAINNVYSSSSYPGFAFS